MSPIPNHAKTDVHEAHSKRSGATKARWDPQGAPKGGWEWRCGSYGAYVACLPLVLRFRTHLPTGFSGQSLTEPGCIDDQGPVPDFRPQARGPGIAGGFHRTARRGIFMAAPDSRSHTTTPDAQLALAPATQKARASYESRTSQGAACPSWGPSLNAHCTASLRSWT